MSAQGRIHELDGVRAIAIALVIVCHYPAFAALLWGAGQFGWVGVEIFFALSGYLITGVLLGLKDQPHAYRIFYGRRVRRILPPYFAVLATCVLIEWISTRHFDLRSLLMEAAFLRSFLDTFTIARGIIASLRHGLPSLIHRSSLPLPVYSRDSTFLPIALQPFWSISVEEWFYLLWAPVVLICRRRGIIAMAAIAIAVGFLVRWLGRADTFAWWSNFFCQLDGLALGALLALWLRFREGAAEKMRRAGDILLSASGIISALLLLVLLAWLPSIPEVRRSVPFAAFGPLLIAVATAAAIGWTVLRSSEPHLVCSALRFPAAVWIGRRSYMLYLAHLAIYSITLPLLRAFGMPHGEWVAAICSLSLSIIVAALSWEILEAPLLHHATKVYAPPPPPAEGAEIITVNG